MVGASNADPQNTWFELGVESLGMNPINKAVPATSIRDSAVELMRGSLISVAEHDMFEIMVLDHVHNENVCDTLRIKEDYREYDVSQTMGYTEAFDYFIRRYSDECAGLEHDPASKWYGISGGKPVRIVLCTYWHDARTVYNDSVRALHERWSDRTVLCPIDEKIGFTKDEPDPETGEQISIRYAKNKTGQTEFINGVEYGWHPTHGRDSEIQQRMGAILASTLAPLLEGGK